MKTMTIEKILRLEPPADRVERVTVSQGLQYKKEDDGIRAIGPLYVNGTYRDREGRTYRENRSRINSPFSSGAGVT